MTVDQLIFVGFNGKAAALDRDTGEIVWTNNQMKSGNVTFLLDEDRLIASTNGYIYCLDPLTGQILWHNPMKGYGYRHRVVGVRSRIEPASRCAAGGPGRAVGPQRGSSTYNGCVSHIPPRQIGQGRKHFFSIAC